jgi:uncharacterized protein (TIGR02145 family)
MICRDFFNPIDREKCMKIGKMKYRSLLSGVTVASFFFCSLAAAADKVVVIPLNTGSNSGKFVDGANPADAVYTDGNVGIGTTTPGALLDVAGGVKIANDSSTCDASKAGLVRWTGSIFEGCNGTAWGSLSPVPTVYSSGHEWMDRNLGASRVATSSTDTAAYGDLYQWGRFADGHESRTSDTTSENASSDVPGHSEFILEDTFPYDWRDPQNDNLWQAASGINNRCPAGFRLPTNTELDNERQSWVSNNATGAFASPLKLVVAGYRGGSDGTITYAGSYGYYWSSTVSGSTSRFLVFGSDGAVMGSNYRAHGYSVRCLKD